LKGRNAARPQVIDYRPHGCGGVRHEHQNIAANDRIKILREGQLSNVSRCKRYIAASGIAGSTACGFEDRGICVDAYDLALRADQPGNKKRHITGTAPEVQYFHTAPNAGVTKQAFGKGLEKCRLDL
jgi:hypothetical protein